MVRPLSVIGSEQSCGNGVPKNEKSIHFVATENETERSKRALHRYDPTLRFKIETGLSPLFIPENLKPTASLIRSKTPFGNRRERGVSRETGLKMDTPSHQGFDLGANRLVRAPQRRNIRRRQPRIASSSIHAAQSMASSPVKGSNRFGSSI